MNQRNTSLGDRVRHERRRCGISQAMLAHPDLSDSYISLIESGKRTPSPEVTAALAERLGCTPTYLLSGVQEQTELRRQPGQTWQQGPPDVDLAPVPDLVLNLPDGLAQDEVVRGLTRAVACYRERMVFKARFFQRHVEGVDKAAEPARYNRRLGQAMAYDETVGHLDESLVEVFELWEQYEHWDQTAQQRSRPDNDRGDQNVQHETPEPP